MAEQMVSLQSLQASRLEEKLARELGAKICGFLSEPHVIEIMLNPDGSLDFPEESGEQFLVTPPV